MIKQQVGEMAIYQEAAEDIVQDTLPKAIKQEPIDFVGKPAVAVESLAPGNPLVYTATFAIMPKVDLKKYQTVKVKKTAPTVDEKKFEQTMTDLKNFGLKISQSIVRHKWETPSPLISISSCWSFH